MAALPKNASFGDLSGVVRSSGDYARHHGKQLTYFQRFFDSFSRVVQGECPEFTTLTSRLGTAFTTAITHEQTIADAEGRLADDLDDLAERYDVILRISLEFKEARKRVQDCRELVDRHKAALLDDERHAGMRKYLIEADLRGALEEKKRQVDACTLKLTEYIDARERYYRFCVRRIKHGYGNLGETMTGGGHGMLESYRAIVGGIRYLRGNLHQYLDLAAPAKADDGDEYAYEYEEEDEEKAPPPPAPPNKRPPKKQPPPPPPKKQPPPPPTKPSPTGPTTPLKGAAPSRAGTASPKSARGTAPPPMSSKK
jgi:hypothetical protein